MALQARNRVAPKASLLLLRETHLLAQVFLVQPHNLLSPLKATEVFRAITGSIITQQVAAIFNSLFSFFGSYSKLFLNN
jgi:hypothetical protein